MLAEMMKAWQFIFSHHPQGDDIMHQILEQPETINTNLLNKWFSEAVGHEVALSVWGPR